MCRIASFARSTAQNKAIVCVAIYLNNDNTFYMAQHSHACACVWCSTALDTSIPEQSGKLCQGDFRGRDIYIDIYIYIYYNIKYIVIEKEKNEKRKIVLFLALYPPKTTPDSENIGENMAQPRALPLTQQSFSCCVAKIALTFLYPSCILSISVPC